MAEGFFCVSYNYQPLTMAMESALVFNVESEQQQCIVTTISGGFRGCRAGSATPPPWRRTDAVTVLLISENGSLLWRRHR